jgi:hypothetical protein
MSWWGTFRLRKSRAELEDLLDGRTESDDALGRTMQAARAEGTPDELAGLEAATAAFRTARAEDADAPEYVPARRGIPVLRRLATATLATKVAIGVAAVAASAVTYAAVDVNRAPAPAPPPASTSASTSPPSSSPASSGSPSRPSSSARQPSRTATPTSRSSTPGSTSRTGSPPASSTTSGVSLAGLCRQWLARPGRHLDLANDPQFRPLLRAAGTAAQIEAYCTDLVGAPTSASKPSRPKVPTSLTPTISTRVKTGSRLHANGVTGIEPSG